MAPHERLRLRHRLLRRGPDSVQLGLDPSSAAAVLHGLLPGEIAALTALRSPHTRAELSAVGARHGIPPLRMDRLVALLRAEGLLTGLAVDRVALLGLTVGAAPCLLRDARVAADDPCPDPGLVRRVLQRPHREVLVDGRGELATLVAEGLRRAGVGRVEIGAEAADELDLALRADHPSTPTTAAPDLVALVAADVLDPRRATPWWRRGTPHLPVVAEGARVSVGPLVGARREGVCLRCLDLHRSDVDPAWPTLLASMTADPWWEPSASTDTTLTLTAAGLVAMVVCGALDGRPLPDGIALELSLPHPRIDHRRWTRHPRCPEHAVTDQAAHRVTMAG